MITVSNELVLESSSLKTAARADPEPPAQGAEVMTTLTRWWVDEVLATFMEVPDYRRRVLPAMQQTEVLLGKPTTYRIRFDENLLADLLQAYSIHGWRAVERMEKLLDDMGGGVEPMLRFYRATRNVIALLIADALPRLDETATAFAKEQWKLSRKTLQTWRNDYFTVLGATVVTFKNNHVGKKLVEVFHEFTLLRQQVEYLQKKIDDRNRKARPDRRGVGAQLWFEIYAAPQRKLMPQMVTSLEDISKTCPAAVLIIDRQVADTHDPYRRALAQADLARAIFGRIGTLLDDLDHLEASVAKPPPTSSLTEVVGRIHAGDTSRISELDPPSGGFEHDVLEVVFGRKPVVKGGTIPDPSDQNRLLANLDMLTSLRDSDRIPAGSMDQIVLCQFVELLTDELERLRVRDELWATFTRWLEVLAAALALVALMVIFPFGEAAAPALVSLLALAGSASVALGIAIMVNAALMGLTRANKLEQSAAEKLFRLGQDDPKAVAEIGEALASSQALRNAVVEGAFITVLSLGAAHQIKLVAHALDIEGFLGDLETVFSALEPSLPPAEPTDDAP